MKVFKNSSKLSLGIMVGLFLLFLTVNSNQAKANTSAMGISFEVFYQGLAPYGNWINDAEFGFIWSPHVGNDFRPYYSDGNWVNTEYGNMWVSHYDWGWAPFHYGRWTMSNRYGWVWVPGYEWGPAWVSWREGGGYYGWAPLRPGVSIQVSFGSGYRVPSSYWTFVPYQNLYASNIYRYHTPRRASRLVNNTTIIHNTYVDNRVTYVSGPSRSNIQRRTGSQVKTYRVNNTNVRSATTARSRVSGDNIAVYRPESTRSSVRASNSRSKNTATRSSRSRATNTPTSRSASAATARSTRSAMTPSRTTTKSTRSATPSRRSSNIGKPATTARATSRTAVKRNAPAGRSTSRGTAVRTTASRQKSAPKATRATPAKKISTPSKRATSTRSSVRSARPTSARSTPQKATVSRSSATRSSSTTARRR